jgi:murein DD-endopeptidase MepM/ murein hydrolase activator NlpD
VILASIDSESGGDPGAIGPEVPGQGRAHGLLQAMDSYWAKFGDLHDPRQNLDIVVGKLMAPAWQKYKSAAHVRAVTYGGPGAIDSNGQIKGYLADAAPAMGGWTIAKDVARYLPKVEAYKRYLQGQQQQPQAPPPQAANGPADLADLWAWLNGNRAPVTGRFGEQDGPYPGTGHRGMDLGVPTGTRLTSPVEGVVMAAGDVGGGYGNQVRIKTAYGSILLGHLSSVNVQPGQRVTPGTMLGATGNTGRSTGSHLHFELRDANDNAIDPARYYRW